jgi:hypothetical protein
VTFEEWLRLKAVRVAAAAVSLALFLGCGGVQRQMREASSIPCATVLARHPSIAADPSYVTQPRFERESYEIKVAECAISRGKPQLAIELAKGWSSEVELTRAKITARAQAAMGDEAATRITLEGLAGDGRLDAGFFTETEELQRFAGSEWFLRLALAVWTVRKQPPIEVFGPRLVHNAGEKLLSLSVASADPTRAPGEWVMWTGVVHDARLDREGDRTLLSAEGIDVKEQLVEVDRSLQSMEVQPHFFGRGATVDPTYKTDRTYEEVFVPNGRNFFVTVPHVSEKLVGLHAITAFGRYRGRDGGNGAPVIEAIAVIERTPSERTESGR